MTHGSLYSGIGGWLLAARWAGIENIFTCEIDKFCNKVLDKHFPETERNYDIKETHFGKYSVDILSTSDPCQPFSFVGKRGGKADDRFLWPQTIRVIREIKPSYVVFENVPGFISMAFETVASDLEAEGYTVESFIIPACAVGAWHRRDRLWIIAYSNSERSRQFRTNPEFSTRGKISNDTGQICENVSDTNTQGLQVATCGKFRGIREKEKSFKGCKPSGANTERWDTWTTEPNVGRVAHGIPSRVDRLKSLGNSIVPQIAYIILKSIKKHERNY